MTAAGMAALPIIFGTSPDPERAPQPSPSTKDSRAPEILELISDSYAKFFNQQREFYESWPDLGKAIAKVGQRVTEDLANPPRMVAACTENLSMCRFQPAGHSEPAPFLFAT